MKRWWILRSRYVLSLQLFDGGDIFVPRGGHTTPNVLPIGLHNKARFEKQQRRLICSRFSQIQVEDESRSAQIPSKAGSSPEQHSALEDTIFKVSGQLSTIARMQKYFRTRENRNFSTVRSTERRILNFSLVEVGMMVAMAALQVLVVRFFFQGARKGEFSFSFPFYIPFFLYSPPQFRWKGKRDEKEN